MSDSNEKSLIEQVTDTVDTVAGRALVEKVSKGIGKLYDDLIASPNRARAEVKAAKIRAKGEGEIREIEHANKMKELMALREYQNACKAVNLAAQSFQPDASKEDIKDFGEDWLFAWWKFAGAVSDEKMQEIWAGVLAGKAQAPTSFKLRTLAILSNMDKDEANQFKNFCQFVLTGGIPLVYNLADDVYRKQNLNYEVIHDLESIGLLTQWSHSTYYETPTMIFLYGANFAQLALKSANSKTALGRYELSTGVVSFTQAGRDLFFLITKNTDVTNMEFWLYVLKKWVDEGLVIRVQTTQENEPAVRSVIGGNIPLQLIIPQSQG